MALTKSLSFSLGRKRILISNNRSDLEQFCADFDSFIPPMTKKQNCNNNNHADDDVNVKFSSYSPLESLPQDILVKVICGLDHDDLNQLFLVSKTVCEAAKSAKEVHFAYCTPSKVKAFRNSIDLSDNPMELDDLEAPNAPKRARRVFHPRINKKQFGEICVALFSGESDEEEQKWPRRNLFVESNS